MQIFKIIRDKDLGLNTHEPNTWGERKTGRAIIFDRNNNIALLYVAKKHYHKLPGGGVEKKEGVVEALKREVVEEIGCEITNIRELGIIEEYRSGLSLRQISHCFVADVNGKKMTPDFTQEEIADGFAVVWLPLDEATKTLEREVGVDDYEGKFINARELTFLKEAKKQFQPQYK